MPGGLEQLAGPPEDAPEGGLAMHGDPFQSAIVALRERARNLNPDAVDAFAQRANGAYPTWKEMSSRIESELENQKTEGATALGELQRPAGNRGLPWIKMGAGLMSPTKTGSIGESMGYGMKGFAEGMDEQNKGDLDFAKKAAEMRYGISKDRTTNVMGLEKLGLQSQQLDYALSMMRSRLGNQQLTPALKEWALVNGINTSDPDWMNKITPEQRQAAMQFINLARGSTQIKNAQAMLDPRNPDFANTVKLLANQTLVSKLMQLAEAHHPMSAYQGQDVSVRNSKVQEEFWNLVRQNSIGSTGGAALPVNGEAGNLQPPVVQPAAAPAAGVPALPAPAAAAPAEEPHPFDPYMAPGKFQPNVPGQIQSEQNEAAQKAAAEAAEKRASSYLEKEVYPGVKAADEMRSSAIIANHLLDKDPKLTGAMKPFMGQIANILTTFGLAPERAQEFATNQELFRSQAMLQVLAKQLDQKGVQTESDAMRIMQAGIDPSKPAQANRFMVRYMESAADRMQEKAAFFDRWSRKNGGQMAGSVEAWSAYSKKFPLARVIDGEVHFREPPK